MLKIKDDVDLKELEKFGFNREYIVDEVAYKKEYKEGLYYKEHMIIWCKDRKLQVDAQELLSTLYDLIQAGLVVKCDE